MASRIPLDDQLTVDLTKITEYLLNLSHDEGAPKAKFFLGRGFALSQPNLLASALIEHGRTQTITATIKSAYGTKYEVQCQLVTPDGKNPCILSVWIQEGKKAPRLITAHPGAD